MNKHLLAIIPARSGSKGLPNKNIKELNGKPLIAYSIEAAINSKIFDTIHVSTDSKLYADIAKNYGADIPFLRDEKNSGDSVSSWDVVREVIEKYERIGQKFDVCVLLQPTSPMRTADDIVNAYNLFQSKHSDSLTSVSEVEHPVQWCFKLDESLLMKDFALSPYKNCRRQELSTFYHENGAIYMVTVDKLKENPFNFYDEKCLAYIMDREKSIDIDNMQDFVFAETIMRMRDSYGL